MMTAAPHMMTAAPHMMTAAPHMMTAAPHMMTAAPHMMIAAPHMMTVWSLQCCVVPVKEWVDYRESKLTPALNVATLTLCCCDLFLECLFSIYGQQALVV